MLAVLGARLHGDADALEDVLDAQPRLAQRLEQLARVDAVAAGLAVLGDAAGAGGVRHVRPRRRRHEGQAAREAAEPAEERIVAARVQDDDVHTRPGRLHLRQHALGIERLGRHVTLALDLGVHGHQIVLAVHLQPVARVAEEADAVGAQPLAELGERAAHVAIARVLVGQHLEARTAQALGHRARVQHGVGEPAGGVVAVADDQRDARLRRRRGGRHRAQHEPDEQGDARVGR